MLKALHLERHPLVRQRIARGPAHAATADGRAERDDEREPPLIERGDHIREAGELRRECCLHGREVETSEQSRLIDPGTMDDGAD